MNTIAFNVNEFVDYLESYAADCRKFCRDTIFTYDNLVAFANCCLEYKDLNKTHVDVAKEILVDEGVVAFLIKIIAEHSDSFFLAKDFALSDRFKAVDWGGFIVPAQKTFYVNIMFDDNDENFARDGWIWADSYITINLPVDLPKEYAKNIFDINLGEDGSWSNYLKLEKFGNKHDIVVNTPKEKQELLEMYRLMNKYLGQ